MRHGIEYRTPEEKHLIRHLIEIIEAAECHISVVFHWRRGNGGEILGQHIAEMAVRQADDLLGKGRVCCPCRVDVHIREHIVDGRQARRVEIADARHLHGRGSMREHGKAVVLRVSREVNENVDLVRAYACRDLLCGHPLYVAPRICRCTQRV